MSEHQFDCQKQYIWWQNSYAYYKSRYESDSMNDLSIYTQLFCRQKNGIVIVRVLAELQVMLRVWADIEAYRV